MVKSVLGVNHQGLRDWLIQNISALFMAIYIIGLLIFLILHPDLSYYEWQALFVSLGMKVATLLFILLLLFHTWIGIWTVVTDYITCFAVRLVVHTIVLLALLSFFFATLLILWGI
ncbi:MAG: succinate dehydrogenase, hydrophobic membrane anchor protein [uncultured bacterium]|nr:MAG: succinate dehydrogenase, hydrophobic membrane anchor protein [uncultured bacterium]